jgi:hypothetical protein
VSDFITARFVDQTNPKLRDAQGRYRNAQAELAAANERMAHQIQRLVVLNIAQRIKRPAVSSDRLVSVTADSRNISPIKGRSAGWKEGIAVGIPSFLDQSTAKYWRTIEEGSESAWKKRKFTGMELPGLWGGSITGLTTTSWGSRALAGPPITAAGAATGGKFVPFGKKRRAFAKHGKIPVVQHEIQPQLAYGAAWRDFDGGTRVRRNLESFLDAIRLKNI